MALYTDIFLDQGTTYSGKIPVLNKEGFAVDLSGYTARGQIRKHYSSNLATDFNAAIEDPSNGEVFVSLTPEQTSALKAGRHVWDVEVFNPDETTVLRIAEGQIHVTPRVTRSPYDYDASPAGPSDAECQAKILGHYVVKDWFYSNSIDL